MPRVMVVSADAGIGGEDAARRSESNSPGAEAGRLVLMAWMSMVCRYFGCQKLVRAGQGQRNRFRKGYGPTSATSAGFWILRGNIFSRISC